MSKRKMVMAGNWKMNKLPSECAEYAKALTEAVGENAPACDLVICVSATLIPSALAATEGTYIKVGAQDVSAHEFGAYTGETAAEMLRDLGVSYCIIGHSERRAMHAETDNMINAKLNRLLSVGVTPIVCVGELLSERESGDAEKVVRTQLEGCLSGVSSAAVTDCVIAYEPVWAIGTGVSATDAQAQEMCAFIRTELGRMYGAEVAENLRILYGGSMNAKNCGGLLNEPDIDGGLVGGASLKPLDFSVLARTCK